MYVASKTQRAISKFTVKKETPNQMFRGERWEYVFGKFTVPTFMWKRFYLFTEDLGEAYKYLETDHHKRMEDLENQIQEEQKFYEQLRVQQQSV